MAVTEMVVNQGLQGIVALETDISRVDGTHARAS
jgi:hypothetical protein